MQTQTVLNDVVDSIHPFVRSRADDSADGKICNIASANNIDIQTLAEVIRDAVEPSLETFNDDARKGDAGHTHADVSKVTELLGYQPSTLAHSLTFVDTNPM